MVSIPFLLFAGGILGGFYASSVGGGSLLTFPLLLLAGLPTPVAIATNRLSAVILEFSSAVKFYKEGKLDMKAGILFGFFAAAGSALGSQIVLSIDPKYLNLIVAILFSMVFLVVLKKKDLGLESHAQKKIHPFIIYAGIFFLGIYGGFFGGGFGTLIIIFLAFLGLDFIKSAAIGRMAGFLMSLSAVVIFAKHSMINYSFALSLGAGMAIGSWIGIGITLKKGGKFMRLLLIIVFLLSIVKLFWEVI